MVTQAGRYYGTPFKVHKGTTQEDPFYPTIFNVLMDEVIRHCVMLVPGE